MSKAIGSENGPAPKQGSQLQDLASQAFGSLSAGLRSRDDRSRSDQRGI